MNKTQTGRIILFILLFILISSFVFGSTGTCSLNRDDPFGIGEIATFSCGCTSAAEENRAGYIVWLLDNGTFLQNTSVTSGLCRTNVFGASYVITDEHINNNGTVIFSLNDDGTGTPLNWGDVGDVRNDSFEIVNGTITDCVIQNVQIPTRIDLGTENANIFEVIDSVTSDPISGISCVAQAFSADGSPILLEPYGEDQSFYTTGHDGIGYLTNTFSHARFKPETTYEFQLLCQCFNDTGSICYDDNTGERLGYHSCQVNGIFTTGVDKRKGSFNSGIYLFCFVLIILGMFIFGYMLLEKHYIVSLLLFAFLIWSLTALGNLFNKITVDTSFETTGLIIFKILFGLNRVLVIYFFIYLIYKFFKWLGIDFVNKINNMLTKIKRRF